MKVFGRIAAVVVVLAMVVAGAFYWNPLWFNDETIRYHLWQGHAESHSVEAGGYRLHYYEAAPPDGTAGIPLVLVHGLGSRSEDWSPLIPGLAAAGFHVYAPDLLGYGRSAKPKVVYSVALEEGVLEAFMNAVGVQRADLDGWSMGGWIAAKFALDHPERVDRLVLDDSAGLKYQLSFSTDAFVPTDAASLQRLMALLSPQPRSLPPFVVRATLRRVKKQGWVVQSSMDSMTSGSDLLDGRLEGIKQPTLIVWGAEDKLIPPAVGEAMHRAIPGSAMDEIAGCGHLAPGECSKAVLAGTVEFLKR